MTNTNALSIYNSLSPAQQQQYLAAHPNDTATIQAAGINTTSAQNQSNNNSYTDIYGDVSQHPTMGQQQPGSGVGTSQGKQVTDLNSIDVSNVDLNAFKYGAAAQNQETKAPGYLNPRNDVLAAYFAKNKITDQQRIYDELNKTASFMGANEQDKQNTAQAIALRIAGQKPRDPIAEQWGGIDQKYAADKEALLKQGAIEDRYTNFNDVEGEVQNVLKVAGEDRLKNGYAGMPSDADIARIAATAGVDPARAKRVLEGFGYETLQMQPEFKKENDRFYNRAIDDLGTNLQRQRADLQTQLEATRTNIQQQQQDVLKQAEDNINAIEAISALSGSKTNTTAFVRGINDMHDTAIKTVNRLESLLKNAEAATEENKGRLLADYNDQLARAKEDLDYQTRDINQQMGTTYSSIVTQYTGPQLLSKLQELNSSMLDAKIEVVNKYTDQLNKVNEQKNKEIDQLVKYDNFLKTQQVDQHGQIIKNQGSVLATMTVNQIADLAKNGSISIEQAKILQQTMLAKVDATLGADATPEDKNRARDYLDAGATPQQAILHTIKDSNGRLKAPNTFINGQAKPDKGGGTGTHTPHNNATIMEQIKNGDITLDAAKKALGLKKMLGAKAEKEIAKQYLAAYAKEGDQKSINAALAELEPMLKNFDDQEAVNEAFGPKAAIQYTVENYDISDPDAVGETIAGFYKDKGQTPTEEEVKQVLDDAGVSGGWFGGGTRNKIWKAIKKAL